MLGNIRDHRKNPSCIYVDAVFEPSWHDNSVKGATHFPSLPQDFGVLEMNETTVAQAVARAQKEWPYPVTVYLYDRRVPLVEPTKHTGGLVH